MAEPSVEPLRDPTARAWLAFEDAVEGMDSLDCVCVRFNHRSFRVNISRDDLSPGRIAADYRWHLSVSDMSQPTHPPRWGDFVAVVHAVRPGVVFCTAVPPRSMWMNVHPGTLHAFEIKDTNLIEQWRQTGEVARAAGFGEPS